MVIWNFLMIKLFIIDDSSLVRNELKKIFSTVDDINIIGSATNPVDAFEVFKKVGLPDVFILDIEMPKMDGIEFLQMIAKQKPIPTIICSTLVTHGSSQAIDALRLGAVDVLLKPTIKIDKFFDDNSYEFIQKVRAAALSQAKFLPNVLRVSPQKVLDENQLSSSIKPNSQKSKKIIAIGASTGGVQTLEEIFCKLHSNHPPIVLTQHMPAGFTQSFADRLNTILPNSSVKEAQDGDTLMHGRILIAPGDLHMEVIKSGFMYKVALKNYPKVNSHKPSVNVLFVSMAKEVSIMGVGILITGMGDDGASGLLAMKQAGAKTYAQDKKSSIVYGMPKKALELGATDQMLNISQIAELINRI